MAGARIFDHAIFHSVEGVALPQNRLLNGGKLGRRDGGFRIVEQGALVPQKACEKVGPVVGGSAGDDTVEVVGKPLRFHEGLAAAVRTTDEVAAGGRSAVEGLHDGARLQCGFMHRAVAEIDQLFRDGRWPRKRRARRDGRRPSPPPRSRA